MAGGRDGLRLHEQLMLIALKDEKGTVESKAGMVHLALGGAILSELVLAGCVEVDSGKKPLVTLLRVKDQRDPVLNECLDLVASATRRRKAAAWVTRFAHVKRLRHRVAERLCRRGILKDSQDRILLLFTRKVYPTIDPVPERQLVDGMRGAIHSDGEIDDPRLAVLLALAHGTGMLAVHFDKQTLRSRKSRLERIAKGELVAGATMEAVRAAQAAVIVATTAATMIATTTATR
jgi:hypothetical protein